VAGDAEAAGNGIGLLPVAGCLLPVPDGRSQLGFLEPGQLFVAICADCGHVK
jgi:hypothetical protein